MIQGFASRFSCFVEDLQRLAEMLITAYTRGRIDRAAKELALLHLFSIMETGFATGTPSSVPFYSNKQTICATPPLGAMRRC